MGRVFDIEKFAVHDGPGIRTAVFMKGCPLRCAWCHNPESQHPHSELFFTPSKCIGCGYCVQACPNKCHVFTKEQHIFDRTNCKRCMKCAEQCYAGALEVAGKDMTAEEVIAEVMKDKIFYDTSNGGVTLTGGEPMAQFDFTLELLKLSKQNGLHTCIETCGYAPWEQYSQILPLIDIFLYDVKATSPEKHKQFTGVDNILIRSNLEKIAENGGKIVLRCPLIPDMNDDDEHLDGIAELAERLSPAVYEVDVEPYHPLGVSKLERLGRNDATTSSEFAPQEKIDYWLSRLQSHTKVLVKKS